MSAICYVLWTLLVVASLADGGIRCDCSINGVTYSLVGINCARPNTTESVNKAVQCEKARYGSVEAGYVVNPGEKTSGYRSVYRLYRTSRHWLDAAESCWRDGGHLAVPGTQSELDFLADQLRRHGGGRTTGAMLGVRRSADEEPFLSVTGEDVETVLSANWPPGTPQSVPRQQCLELQTTGPKVAALRSRDCGQPAAYFCERSLSAPVNSKYSFVSGLGFYMPLAQLLPYPGAEQQCQATGGHLVVPDTQQEADALVQAFDMYPQVEQIYVGIDDRRQAGVFETVHGGLLEWLDFQNWAPGALETRSADIHCVTFTASGNYQLVHCDTPLPTICEWKL
ncbi:uncharacterized protein LOC126162526 [Schistocerca cancellata]|uniref:uncharacterized protein LOC126162526 n=1 Tax=Schistocerca cancellata TaxID=274614 RepID=UPI0021182FF9|nr:uncharacterized protein LOC126162526 [Schistocerca cancellata]